MTEDPIAEPRPTAIEVVSRTVADEIVAAAFARIRELEGELAEAERARARAEVLDEGARFLLEQAEMLVDEAHAHRARVIGAARAEAAGIIDAIPAPTNGQQ